MKLLIILQIVLALLLDPPSVYVKGEGYSGYIFKKEHFEKEHFVILFIENQQGRFTPTPEEVEAAEKLVKARLPVLNKNKSNQSGTCPNIEKKLESYTRQYVGISNKTGEKVIWINMVMHPSDEASEGIIFVLDGCSNYWNVKVNLTTGEVYDLGINGSA
jgi:hypothetical protein